MEVLMYYVAVLAVTFLFGLIFYYWFKDSYQYKYLNSNRRVCRKCGAHQVKFQKLLDTGWEKVGLYCKNPNCKCHKDLLRDN